MHHKKKTHHAPVAAKPVQQPSTPVVATAPVATHLLPVAPNKPSHDGGNSSLLAFAALALLVLAGASAYMLRFTLRLAQPQRTI